MAVDDSILAAMPFFDILTPEQRRPLARALVTRRFMPYTPVFEEGEPARACAFLVSGVVHVDIAVGASVPRERVDTMGPGQIFGEVALLDGRPRTASCRAGQDGAVVALLSREDFMLLFESGHPFAFALVRLIARQLVERLRKTGRVWRDAVLADGSTDTVD